MLPRVTLYLRYTKQPYSRVDFKNHKPIVPKDYDGVFYLRLSENGKRKWISFKTLTEALTRQSNIETNLDRVRKGIAAIARSRARTGSHRQG